MKPMILLGLAALFTAGCPSPNPGQLLAPGGRAGDGAQALASDSLGAGANTPQHFQDPNMGQNGLTDPNQVQAQTQKVGSAEAVARLHGCTKVTYAALGALLTSRGVDLTNQQSGSAGQLYAQGSSSLGVANYPGRVPEALNPSTATLAKEDDILVAAAAEMLTNGTFASGTACAGTALLDASGNSTKDGISCVLGKAATADHVTLANQVITLAADRATGQQLALAALLEAAHTCE